MTLRDDLHRLIDGFSEAQLGDASILLDAVLAQESAGQVLARVRDPEVDAWQRTNPRSGRVRGWPERRMGNPRGHGRVAALVGHRARAPTASRQTQAVILGWSLLALALPGRETATRELVAPHTPYLLI